MIREEDFKKIDEITSIELKNIHKSIIPLEKLFFETVYLCVMETKFIWKYQKNLKGTIEMIKDLVTPIAKNNDLLGSICYMCELNGEANSFVNSYHKLYSELGGRDIDFFLYNALCANIFEKWKIYKKNNEQ